MIKTHYAHTIIRYIIHNQKGISVNLLSVRSLPRLGEYLILIIKNVISSEIVNDIAKHIGFK